MNAQELNNEMETNMHETNRQGAIEKKREKKPLPFSWMIQNFNCQAFAQATCHNIQVQLITATQKFT